MCNFKFYTERGSTTAYAPGSLAEEDWRIDWTSSNRIAINICGGKNIKIKNLYCEYFEYDIKIDLAMQANTNVDNLAKVNENISIINHTSKNVTSQTVYMNNVSNVAIEKANYTLATGLGHHYHHIYCSSYTENVTVLDSKFYVQDEHPGASINFASAYTDEINTSENPQNLIVKNCEFYNVHGAIAAKGNSNCYAENIKILGESYWNPSNEESGYYFASKQLFRFLQESTIEIKDSYISTHVLLCLPYSKKIKFTSCDIFIQNNNLFYSNSNVEGEHELIFDNCNITFEDNNNAVKSLNCGYLGDNLNSITVTINNCNINITSNNLGYLFTARNNANAIIIKNSNFISKSIINNVFYNISNAKKIEIKECTIEGFKQLVQNSEIQYVQVENVNII